MVVWFLALVLQIAALGCSLYQLVQLTDLELDQINPHDAAKNYNRAVYPALILECVLCIVTAVGGKWLGRRWGVVALQKDLKLGKLRI